MKLLYVSKSAEDAYKHIERFYSRFHSYYFDGDFITIRLMEEILEKRMGWIRQDFPDLMPKMDMVQLPSDQDDPEPLLAGLPRLRFTFRRGDYARLRELIDYINA